jgi:hypothetical protein
MALEKLRNYWEQALVPIVKALSNSRLQQSLGLHYQ